MDVTDAMLSSYSQATGEAVTVQITHGLGMTLMSAISGIRELWQKVEWG